VSTMDTSETTTQVDEIAAAVAAERARLVDVAVRAARHLGINCGEFGKIMNEIVPDMAPFLDSDGFNCRGYDVEGFDINGYNISGYNRDGYDPEGYDREGWNADGVNRYGERRDDLDTIYRWDADGYDIDGFDADGNSRFRLTRLDVAHNRAHPELFVYDRDGNRRPE
jgi:hypothetical protein